MSDLEEDDLSISTAVAGVSYRQDAVSRCRVGQPVRLIRDPLNEHDENAIEVHADKQIGFIPKDLAETLALYLDYCGQDTVEARIDRLTEGADQERGGGVIIDITLSAALYELVEEDAEFIRGSIIKEKRAAAINARLTDEEVQNYIQNIDDDRLDARYWVKKQNEWEEEQKKKARKRLGRELETYEEDEIEERAEKKFQKYSEKHEVTSYDRQKIRGALSRSDVVSLILVDQDMQEMEEKIEKEHQQENSRVAMGLLVLVLIAAIVVLVSVS